MNIFSLIKEGFCIELRDSLLNVYYDTNFVKIKAEGLKLVKEHEVSFLFVARDGAEFRIMKDIFNKTTFLSDTVEFSVKLTEGEKNNLLDFLHETLKA